MQSRILEVIGDPVIELAYAKNYLKVDSSNTLDDALISNFIEAATLQCERYTGLFFREKKVEVTLIQGNAEEYGLPYGPNMDVESVVRVNDDGDEALTLSETYWLSGVSFLSVRTNRRVSLMTYNRNVRYPQSLKVTYTAGYSPEEGKESLPEDVRVAILQLVAEMYENRQNSISGTIVAVLPNETKKMLNPLKRTTLF